MTLGLGAAYGCQFIHLSKHVIFFFFKYHRAKLMIRGCQNCLKMNVSYCCFFAVWLSQSMLLFSHAKLWIAIALIDLNLPEGDNITQNGIFNCAQQTR